MNILQPPGWNKPRGYVHGVSATGKQVFVAGQVGWNAQEKFESDDFIDQAKQALENIKAVMAEADATPEHMTRMTWYVLSKEEYLSDTKRLGEAYRAVMGNNYPAMTAVEVSNLMAKGSKLEIEVTAVVPVK